MIAETKMASKRLTELLRMRNFIDQEIAAERRRLAGDGTASLVRSAAMLYGVDVEEILAPTKGDRAVQNARLMACWLLRETGLSYPEVGRRLKRDHSTVMRAVRIIDCDATRRALAREIYTQEVAA